MYVCVHIGFLILRISCRWDDIYRSSRGFDHGLSEILTLKLDIKDILRPKHGHVQYKENQVPDPTFGVPC